MSLPRRSGMGAAQVSAALGKVTLGAEQVASLGQSCSPSLRSPRGGAGQCHSPTIGCGHCVQLPSWVALMPRDLGLAHLGSKPIRRGHFPVTSWAQGSHVTETHTIRLEGGGHGRVGGAGSPAEGGWGEME